MTKNKAKISSNLELMVSLLSEDEVTSEMGEAFASFMLNPTVVWAKFILTDDRKNANGQRIPREEFQNLMKSGVHMPVKMAIGEIKEGHDSSKPLGVITHLKEVTTPDGFNALVALAALWGEERPADVKFIRERFKNGEPVNISWEILYEDGLFNEQANSIDLSGTVLRAATIVGTPAYEGRTQFLSVAAKKWSKAYIESLPDSSFLVVERGGNRLFPILDDTGKVDRTRLKETMIELGESNLPMPVIREKKKVLQTLIDKFEAGASVDEVSEEYVGDTRPLVEEVKLKTAEELQAEISNLTAKLNEALLNLQAKETAFAEKDSALAEKDAEIERLTNLNKEYETELVPLKEFKASVDAEIEKETKLAEVKTKFVEAGLDKGEEFYSENSERLIALDEASLDFMIQELKAFADNSNSAVASKKNKIPVLNTDTTEDFSDPKELGKMLRESKTKK